MQARPKRRVQHQNDANATVPNDVTEVFRERIMALPDSLKTSHLKSEIFSKFVSDDTDPPLTRRTRAINKWLAAERDNEATNVRLILTPEEFQILPRVPYNRFMSFCRQLVIDIIGETPPIEALLGSFSGGASTSRGRTESHPASKYLGKADVTQRAMDWFHLLKDEIPIWFCEQGDDFLNIVPGNVMFTVPKKTDIDRCACKEPDINMFMQKGIGDHFRRSLRSVGINLNDQSINRSFAQVGSLDGSLATLDLSSASDSVTRQLVFELLPVCWHTLLDSVRSQVTVIDGETHVNEMFSSMGNGFTFELESLLFYVLMRATTYFGGISGIVSVYGDDIIIPTKAVDKAIYVLSYFGFQANPDKSFWVGDFRESCGGSFHSGYDITPFYVKGPIRKLTDLIDVANKLRKWASNDFPDPQLHSMIPVIDPWVSELWEWLRSMVPTCLRGGGDFSFKYQLVSSDQPSHRLSEKAVRKGTGTGGYLHWLNATWKREGLYEGIETSSYNVTHSVCRLRPVSPHKRAVPRLPAWTLNELG